MKILVCLAMNSLCLGLGVWLGGVLLPEAVEAWGDAGAVGPRVTLDAAPALPARDAEPSQRSSLPQAEELEYAGPWYSAAYSEHWRRARPISIWLGGALLMLGPVLANVGSWVGMINDPLRGSRDGEGVERVEARVMLPGDGVA